MVYNTAINLNKIYLMASDITNHCYFMHKFSNVDDEIQGVAMKNAWKSFNDNFQPVILELERNESGKKNYQFDISGFSSPFFVISEFALSALSDILEPRGQLLPVITESKRRQFFGYYPTNPLSGCFDKEKSDYRVAERGLIIEKPVLIAKNITDEYLFSIDEDISRVFVTEKFKQRVEEAGLLGFDFSVEIPTS